MGSLNAQGLGHGETGKDLEAKKCHPEVFEGEAHAGREDRVDVPRMMGIRPPPEKSRGEETSGHLLEEQIAMTGENG